MLKLTRYEVFLTFRYPVATGSYHKPEVVYKTGTKVDAEFFFKGAADRHAHMMNNLIPWSAGRYFVRKI